MHESLTVVPTGIPSLDLLLGGGIPPRQSVIVSGAPGTGKTILCSQIAFAQAARGTRVVLATITSEPHDKLLQELRSFSFFDHARLGDDIRLLSAYSWFQQGGREARDGLLKEIRERRAGLLFIDGLRSVRDLWQDEARMRDFLYDLNVGLANLGAIGLFSTEYSLQQVLDMPEATTVDGIISLTSATHGEHLVRRAQVWKLRGRRHLLGQHAMRIGHSGIRITPRLEARARPGPEQEPPDERVQFGLPELDQLLHGGLYRQTTTVMAGSTGVGKTLLSMHFAASGARAGESALFVSFTEPAARLAQRARRIGLDLGPALQSGMLHLRYLPAIEEEADELVDAILGDIRETGARRLVIDGLSILQQRLLDARCRAHPFFAALLNELRRTGVTAIFVKEVAKLAGPELDLSDSPAAALAENNLFLRHIEFAGRVRRILSILKMHDSGYDPSVREFEISGSGLRVLEPISAEGGLFTGIARPIPGRPLEYGGPGGRLVP
jgi:circadian clock protein KaiC